MAEWGNVTKSALWASREEHGPSALEREWSSLLAGERDMVFLSTGACRRREGPAESWSALWWWVSDRPGESEKPPPPLAVPAGSVERLLSPLAHEGRIRVMQVLYERARPAGELSEATGMKGGNLYYHLRELVHGGYVAEGDGGYELTTLGTQMLITVTCIADNVVRDRGEDGLQVGDVSEG